MVKKEKQKKVVTPGWFATKLIFWIILNQFVLVFGFGMLIGLISAIFGLSEMTMTILALFGSILMIVLGYIGGVKDTLRRNTTSRANINKVMKIFTIVVVIWMVITSGIGVYDVVKTKKQTSEAIEQLKNMDESNYGKVTLFDGKLILITEESIEEIIEESKQITNMSMIISVVSMLVTIGVRIWMICYTRRKLVENLDGVPNDNEVNEVQIHEPTSEEIKRRYNSYSYENKSNNGTIIIIILAVIIVGLIIALILAFNNMVNMNNDNETTDDTINETIDKSEQDKDNEENKQDENEDIKDENKDNEEETVDPYANYQSMVWASEKADFGGGFGYKIISGKLYMLNDSKETKISGITGTPKKLLKVIRGGAFACYVLTEEQNVYYVEYDDSNNKVASMSKYNIIDMTQLNNYTNESIYYLTSDGKLIDKNGVSYDKYNFVSSYGGIGTGVSEPIPFDKNLNGYYYNSKNNTYTAIVSKSTGAKLAFSKVYEVEDGAKLLVQTAYNKLFEYDGESNKAVQITGDVSSVKKIEGEDSLNLAVIFKDGTTKIFKNAINGYDIKKNKNIELESLGNFDFAKIVQDGVKIYNEKAAMSNCGDSSEPLMMNIKAPKITLLTSNTTKINKEIADKYNKMTIDTNKGGYHLTVNYTYNYIQNKELLLITIEEEYAAVCATGGISIVNYIYDVRNDKFIDFTELLNRYYITEQQLKDKIYLTYYEKIQNYYEDDVMQVINDKIKNNEIQVKSIGTNYIDICVPPEILGFTMKIYTN